MVPDAFFPRHAGRGAQVVVARRIVILGAGGHARETAWVAESVGFEVVGFVVSDTSKLTDRDSASRVLGDLCWLVDNQREFDAIAVGIGNPRARRQVAEKVSALVPSRAWPTLVHPTATIDHKTAELAPGSYVGAGVVATVAVRLAPWACLNFGCTVGHEGYVGRATVVNPGASVSGGVVLGDEVLVGTGARVLQYVNVGEGATVGAGAVVLRDVEPYTTVVGVPARVVRRER